MIERDYGQPVRKELKSKKQIYLLNKCSIDLSELRLFTNFFKSVSLTINILLKHLIF